MRSHEERVAEAKRRIAKMEREKRLRRNTVTAASAVAACLALIVGVSFVLPDIAVKVQTGGYAGFETAASIFHGGAALGYILSLIHISEPTRPGTVSRMPSSA